MLCKSLIRSYSTSRSKNLSSKSESLVKDHMDSEEPTTYLVVNKILLNQNISNSKKKFDELLNVKGEEIELPTGDDKIILNKLTGSSKYKGHMGVYMFIHKKTGQKYVGSSNLLRRRMEYYFKGDFVLAGKFLPLLHKEGLGAFRLIIFRLDNTKFSSIDALYLEQYYLLQKEFNLNTLRVVNAGSAKGNCVYVYDLKCNTLYYHAKSQIELKRVLKVHPETCKKYIDTGNPYLDQFILLSYHVPTASPSNKTVNELLDIMQTGRKAIYTLGNTGTAVTLEILKDNTFVDSSKIGTTLRFNSLTLCIEYLNSVGIDIKRETLSRYIKNDKVFHNFLCKHTDKFVSIPEISLIIDEYKKLKVDNLNADSNKKNKSLIVKSENFEMEFNSITDGIKYFKDQGIYLDRKYLYLKIIDGKKYKGYTFSFKIS